MEQVQKPRERLDSPRPNHTGIPGRMKRDFERRSGLAFDDVRVHYNSDGPARLGALAYTRGTQVYLGPGQERYLPHELGHVVQQKTRPVPATRRGGGMPVNDDPALEAEADRWGAGAGMGGTAVQLYQGQDVAQCGGMLSMPHKTWLDELYKYIITLLPDLSPWKTLPKHMKLGENRGKETVTPAMFIEKVQNFRTAPSIDTWEELKTVLIDTLDVNEETFNDPDKKGLQFEALGRIRKLAVQAEQMVETMAVDQEPDKAYVDLPRYISRAKKMVYDTVIAIKDPKSLRYRKYFVPQPEWNAGKLRKRDNSRSEDPDLSILPMSLPFGGVKTPSEEEKDDPLPSDFLGKWQALLQRSTYGDMSKLIIEWYNLQSIRPENAEGTGVLENREAVAGILSSGKSKVTLDKNNEKEDSLREQKERATGALAHPLVLHRYGQILQGLEWLEKDPYLKVMYQPWEKSTYGETIGGAERHASLNLLGAFQKKPKETGRDSRPGVLIHELSHSFAETKDNGYGNEIKKLYVLNAVENADTYEYAAENAFNVSEEASEKNPDPAPDAERQPPQLEKAAKQTSG